MHTLKPLGYVRYGDDFILFAPSENEIERMLTEGSHFLKKDLQLKLHEQNHAIQPTKQKIHFLGLYLWPTGRSLDKRMVRRTDERISLGNIASYKALLNNHGSDKMLKNIDWQLLDKLDV